MKMSQDKPWEEIITRVYIIKHPVYLELEVMNDFENESFILFDNIACENSEESQLLNPEGPLACWDGVANYEGIADRVVINGSEGPESYGANIRLIVPVEKILNWGEVSPLFSKS